MRGEGARHLAVVGPTASGKSTLALALARAHPGFEIVVADAMQVYRGMDVGTAKPTVAERAEVPHHLLDLADPAEDFSVARFQVAARAAIAGIEARGARALLVGGSGLYVQAVVDDLDLPGEWPDVRAELEAEPDTAFLHSRLARLDPLAASRTTPTNRRRVVRALEVTVGGGRPFSSYGPGLGAYPPGRFLLVGLAWPRPALDRRIAARLAAMVQGGLVAEVRDLAARPHGLSRTARQAIGYAELLDHLAGARGLDEAVAAAVARTQRFARRQERWFRRDARIRWCAGDDPNLLAAVPPPLGDWAGCA